MSPRKTFAPPLLFNVCYNEIRKMSYQKPICKKMLEDDENKCLSTMSKTVNMVMVKEVLETP